MEREPKYEGCLPVTIEHPGEREKRINKTKPKKVYCDYSVDRKSAGAMGGSRASPRSATAEIAGIGGGLAGTSVRQHKAVSLDERSVMR